MGGAAIIPTRQYTIGALADFRHRQTEPWPVVPQLYKLSVSAAVHRKEHGKKLWELGDGIVPKNVWIKFTLKTDVPSPYETRWQVVNTGREAAAERQLRGDFYSSEINTNNTRWEHWVEAFVIKNGVCVVRSGRMYVRVGSYL